MSCLDTVKRISDPIHGTIELCKLEAELVSSRAFQRLHNVKQLGLAHYIFPAANYSRLSHSVGACNNARKLLTAIENNRNHGGLDEGEKLRVRVAALLHDIGHYPFSHAFEHEIRDYYSEVAPDILAPPDVLNHEDMGLEVIKRDPQIQQILNRHDLDAEQIEAIKDKDASRYSGILESDLDCDRLDYLRRTAHHSGLPYGNVDIDYLIDQATLDQKDQFCYSYKALRAADHLLVSRYFDYLQVPYHKSVVALEWSLRVVIRELLARKVITCGAGDMRTAVANGSWTHFDDGAIFAHASKLARSLQKKAISRDVGVIRHIEAILHRVPADLVASYEAVGQKVSGSSNESAIEGVLADYRRTKGLCELALHLWKPKDFALIKASTRTADAMDVSQDEPEYKEYVHIRDLEGGRAQPIFKYHHSLMRSIHKFRYRAHRVYAMTGGNRAFIDDLKTTLQPQLREVGMRVSALS